MMNWNFPVQAVDAFYLLMGSLPKLADRSSALDTDQYFPVTVHPYCHPDADNAKIQE